MLPVKNRCVLSILLLLNAATISSAKADDWSQWLGNNRDSRWTETGIVDTLSKDQKVLWRTPIESGYAGPAVVGNRVFVTDYQVANGVNEPNPGKRTELEGSERIICLDAESGKQVWKHEYPCEYKISYAYGPRCTPTINEGHVYALGAEGDLVCLNADNGELAWKKNLKAEYKQEQSPMWGYAGHLLVHGDKVFTLAGGDGSVVVALDKKTGQEVWRALSSKSIGYCPPTLIKSGGQEQLIVWDSENLNSLNPATGHVYWTFPLKPAYEMSIIAPVCDGNYLLATALQGKSLLLKLNPAEPAASIVWRDRGLHSDNNPPIIVDGYMYGVDENGQLRCIELETGERVWESLATTAKGRPAPATTGFVVKNGDKYFLVNEVGELILAKMSPDGFEEIGRTKMVEPTSSSFGRKVVWSHPAFANKCVYMRNDKEIICMSLAK
jgi:outer membrane protein assembly factor BamB